MKHFFRAIYLNPKLNLMIGYRKKEQDVDSIIAFEDEKGKNNAITYNKNGVSFTNLDKDKESFVEFNNN